MKLSLIIPAHNEAKKIVQTLTEYTVFLRQKFFNDFEIIVVENGSMDQTAQLVVDFQIHNPEVTLIKELVPAKGKAVRLGFTRAQGDWISFVDADNAIPPLEWKKLFNSLTEGVDTVIASRFLPGSAVSNRTWFRRISGQIFSLFVRIFFQMPFHDTQCGAKIIRGLLIKEILPKLKVDNMAMDVEMLWSLHKAGAKIKEVPINWQGGLGSAVARPAKFIKQAIKMFWSLFSIRFFN